MIITVIAELGEFQVELPDTITVNQLPEFIQKYGGIVVPILIEETQPAKLFLPAAQIQGISWLTDEKAPPAEDTADLAEVSYIEPDEAAIDLTDVEEAEVVKPGRGDNGEVWTDG